METNPDTHIVVDYTQPTTQPTTQPAQPVTLHAPHPPSTPCPTRNLTNPTNPTNHCLTNQSLTSIEVVSYVPYNIKHIIGQFCVLLAAVVICAYYDLCTFYKLVKSPSTICIMVGVPLQLISRVLCELNKYSVCASHVYYAVKLMNVVLYALLWLATPHQLLVLMSIVVICV